MRKPNPLSEILEASMLQSEPMLDTEWPAGDVELKEVPKPEREMSQYAPRLVVPRAR